MRRRLTAFPAKARTHGTIDSNFSSGRTAYPTMTGSCGGMMGPGFRRGSVRSAFFRQSSTQSSSGLRRQGWRCATGIRAANGPCRSYSSGFGTEVRLFLENRTTAAVNVRTGAAGVGEQLVER
jgi:hypothetical protein